MNDIIDREDIICAHTKYCCPDGCGCRCASCAAGLPSHTCRQGPLCAYWFSSGHPEDPGACIHGSCMDIVHGFCPRCMIEDLREDAERARTEGPFRFDRHAGPRCPAEGCGAPLVCTGQYGAPGAGYSWHCTAGLPDVQHHWAEATPGQLYRPDAGAHIMTEAEVI